ncbi:MULTISPECIES: DinB family protein [Arenibacter]|uniref:DinB family protein n=1 Tax=Arenibacter TaxID=178469 RepID=UPI001C07DAAF|nr:MULTISPECIES: DinB family protein [Arenibacter]MBU2905667.1 DinB family protein [Arenibacter algicola]MCK0133760.1 DinB family protein [Arenibacter sp. S6351L]
MRKSDLPKEAYDQFYGTYLSVLDDSELKVLLVNGKTEFANFIKNIPDNKLHSTYEIGKWTIAEVILHIIDAERVFQYRALRFLRNDKTPLPGFDQDLFVKHSNANTRDKDSLIAEFKAVREASITLFLNLKNEDLSRTGTASNIEWTVGTLGFVICGHLKHHQQIILHRYLQA